MHVLTAGGVSQDPAVATSRKINGPYESYDRGTQKKAWVTEDDGTTPLVGEVSCVCVRVCLCLFVCLQIYLSDCVCVFV